MIKVFFSIIWLILIVIFIVYLHNADGIFEKLEILGIKDNLITFDFYMMFGIFSFFLTAYTTYVTYKDKFKYIIESKEKVLINMSRLLYSILIFILIGISFLIIQRNLLLADMVSEKKQENYIKSLEERIKVLENKLTNEITK
ncbi:hypothetical protein [Aliarcobacter butzleri]|uniref:hypothetical protein n=1 Tax=Aliarcobacter butzleri TaxID=28197 RepID=UPI00263C0DEE|nr:hypothetical protein [Aliarcobacter butzleri]MDN5059288.1 hypothetical protein [Aliarcobacter butzleri]